MLKVAILTGEVEEEINGRSSQSKSNIHFDLSLCITSIPFGWRHSYRQVNPSLFGLSDPLILTTDVAHVREHVRKSVRHQEM